MSNIIPAYMASSPEDYKKLNMTRKIEPWEDALRTTGKKGDYEWWYFDARLNGGTSLVIVFYTAPFTALEAGFHPSISFTLTRQDGSMVSDLCDWKVNDFQFAKDHCKAQIGPNLFEGDLHTYHIHYENGGILADVDLTGNIPSWRQETGHIQFGEDKYFAWLPSVPEGHVKATITAEGKTEQYEGSGYHDHNWGNTGMYTLMHHWYWGRAKIGEYQAITSYITAQKQYSYKHFTVFLLAKNGTIVCDESNKVTYTQMNLDYNEKTHKHFYKDIAYDYRNGNEHYRVSYSQEKVIDEHFLLDAMDISKEKRMALQQGMKQAGLDPSYLRLTGTAKVEKFENDALVETQEAPALWEMMYFGEDADV